jgi:thiol-disulfide isomerase/thioredoxin
MRSSTISLLFLFTLLFFSCGSKEVSSQNPGKPGKFSIEGKLANGTGRKVFLQKIGTDAFIPVDTAVLNEKGEFSFRETTASPDFFIVRTENGPFINLIIYGHEKIRITADYNDLKNYTVEGSPESEKIRALNEETTRVIGEIDKFNLMARDSASSPNFSKLMTKNNEDFQVLMTGLKQFSTAFINENQNSLISLLALYGQVGPQMGVFHPIRDMGLFEKLDTTLMKIYPTHPLVQNLHEYNAVIKAQLAAQQQTPPGTFPVGTEVPDIALAAPDGKIVKLSSLRGKVVLLDFWASWCQPCRHENPTLVENYAKYHSKGFDIYQVSLDRERQDWLNGIQQDNLTWNHVSDLKYWQSSVVSQFSIRGIPMNYLLDKEGKVIASNLRGPALGEKLMQIYGE